MRYKVVLKMIGLGSKLLLVSIVTAGLLGLLTDSVHYVF